MNERIKTLRKALGLTLEKFGERLGVSKVAISLIESGKNSVTDQMFKSICREFNVNEEWLRDGTGDMFKEPDDEVAELVSNLLEEPETAFHSMILNIMRTYEQLKPDSKEVLQDFCKMLLDNEKNRKA